MANIGDKIGKLTITEVTQERKYAGYIVYVAQCECGNAKKGIITDFHKYPACTECSKENHRKAVTTHGLTVINMRLYSICKQAHQRCTSPQSTSYKDYGGRGIRFEFDSVEHMFYWSLENGYAEGLEIDRIDVDCSYSPDNCRWVTKTVQANNKRNNLSLHGLVGIKAIAEYIGISEKRLGNYMYKKHMTVEEVYELSKSCEWFFASVSEKKSMAQKYRQDGVISKEEAIKIVENIKNGSNISREAKRLERDYATVKKAIRKLEEGRYAS